MRKLTLADCEHYNKQYLCIPIDDRFHICIRTVKTNLLFITVGERYSFSSALILFLLTFCRDQQNSITIGGKATCHETLNVCCARIKHAGRPSAWPGCDVIGVE